MEGCWEWRGGARLRGRGARAPLFADKRRRLIRGVGRLREEGLGSKQSALAWF